MRLASFGTGGMGRELLDIASGSAPDIVFVTDAPDRFLAFPLSLPISSYRLTSYPLRLEAQPTAAPWLSVLPVVPLPA